MQTKHIYHCYLDHDYHDERRSDRGGNCKACVSDGAHLQKRKSAKMNRLQETKRKRTHKASLRAEVRGKRQRKS